MFLIFFIQTEDSVEYGATDMAAEGVNVNRKCFPVLTKGRHKKYWYVITDYDIFLAGSVTVFFCQPYLPYCLDGN